MFKKGCGVLLLPAGSYMARKSTVEANWRSSSAGGEWLGAEGDPDLEFVGFESSRLRQLRRNPMYPDALAHSESKS
jgi:hypothetical protein